MPALAKFVLSGPGQAALVAAGALVVALLLPPLLAGGNLGALMLVGMGMAVLLVFSGATVALVWLRKSGTEAVLALAMALLACGLVSWLNLGSAFPALLLAVVFWLPTVPLALVLRHTVRMDLTVLLAGAMGGALVLGVHLSLGDPAAFWLQRLQEVFAAPADGAAGVDPEQVTQALQMVAGLMTGLLVSSLVMNALGSLMLARWLQAKLFNPGGFRQEFYSLRLGRSAAAIIAALGLGWMLGNSQLIAGLAFVGLLLATLQGLAIVHQQLAQRGSGKGWLVALYALIGLVPHTALILAFLGIADSWVDFRTRGKSGPTA